MFYQLLISHFIFDYGKALTPSMIRDKSIGKLGWPIALHALLHAIGVTIVLLVNSVNITLAKSEKSISLAFISIRSISTLNY